MTDSKKKKIDALIYALVYEAKNCGYAEGVKGALEDGARFNFGVNPEEAISKFKANTEDVMNQLFRALGMPKYQEHNYLPEEEA